VHGSTIRRSGGGWFRTQWQNTDSISLLIIYVKNNPIRFIDLFGLQDTLVHPPLPNVEIVAKRNPPTQSGFITFLYGIDRLIEGNSNSRKVNDADWWDNWCIRHFDMRIVQEIGEAMSDPKADPTLRNYVRTNESYQGKMEDKKIQEENAGNNKEIIENSPLIKKYKGFN
jgi:hypothetical protein